MGMGVNVALTAPASRPSSTGLFYSPCETALDVVFLIFLFSCAWVPGENPSSKWQPPCARMREGLTCLAVITTMMTNVSLFDQKVEIYPHILDTGSAGK